MAIRANILGSGVDQFYLRSEADDVSVKQHITLQSQVAWSYDGERMGLISGPDGGVQHLLISPKMASPFLIFCSPAVVF